MGLFSTPKCPVHGIEYKIGKNYMCQMYYYCPMCRNNNRKISEIKKELEELKERLNRLENK